MTSTNHFRHRRLGKSLPAPISPRHAVFHAEIIPPPPGGAFYTIDIDVVSGIHESSYQATLAPFENWAGGVYFTIATDNQDQPCAVQIHLSLGATTFTAQYLADWGSGLNVVAEILAAPYNGDTTFDSGVLNWTGVGTSVGGTGQFILEHSPHPP